MDWSGSGRTRRGIKKVVVLGGGFAGLEVAKHLADAPASVIVIDKQNHHCFQPLLYQVATAALAAGDVAWPIRSILSSQLNASVIMASVAGIDLERKLVRTDRTDPIAYDILVVATGTTHSYFGNDAWEYWAPGLKRVEDALNIRQKLLRAFEAAEIEPNPAEQKRLMTFAVIGGGPTGVELAGAITEMARFTLAKDFRRIDPKSACVFLIEAGPRILPTFPPRLSAYADKALSDKGAIVCTSTRVIGCDPEGVVTTDRRIRAATLIWAAGVQASPAAAWLGVEGDRAGRIGVTERLTLPGHEDVFVIGDVAAVVSGGRPVPGIAPAAKQMGKYVARQIRSHIGGTSIPLAFRYRHWGDLATIGRSSAVIAFGKWQFKGRVAWIAWSITHIYFLIGLRNRISVAAAWLWEYLTYQRGARLINRSKPGDNPQSAKAAIVSKVRS